MSAHGDPEALDLSGRWRVGVADEELRRVWYDHDFDDSAFSNIDVPGHWRSHPDFADNDDPLLYRRRFSTVRAHPGTRSWLESAGICAQGDLWLDGNYLGNTDGAWVPHAFEVTEQLAARRDHTLGVEVASPPLGDPDAKRGLLGTWQDGPYVEPGWNPGGIWRPVTIRRTGPVAVIGHRVVCTAATAARATVTFACTLDAVEQTEVTISSTVGDTDHEERHTLARGANEVQWTVDVTNPELWWPAELGDQPLTRATVAVLTDHRLRKPRDPEGGPGGGGDDQAARVSDTFTRRIGLRRVRLDDWICTVNGERLFLRGVLVGPVAQDLARAPEAAFTDQVAAARRAGANLIRVHAHLSRDELYDAADEAGMLIWQDLPLFRSQHRSVRKLAIRTARCAVESLGAHPSIVIWCAHDDPDGAERASDGRGHALARRFAAHELPNWNRSVLDRVVKRTLLAADPSRPAIGSSGTWPHPPTLTGTDTHLHLGWSGGEAADLDRLARAVPRAVRFVQVTPSPSLPLEATPVGEATWPAIDLDEIVAGSDVDADVLGRRLPPDAFDDFDQWHRASLNYQAQLIRTQIETLRRLKYRPTGGFVVAHLQDERPIMAPSLVDHTGTVKPAHDAFAAACAPVLVTLSPWPVCLHPGEELRCDVHVVSDLRATLHEARLGVRLRWSGGEERWTFGGELPADSCIRVGQIRFEVPDGVDAVSAALHLSATGHRAESHYRVPVHRH